MALPFGRATFFGPGGAKGGSVFSEFGTIGSVFVVQGYQEGKCAVMPRKERKRRRATKDPGHQKGKYAVVPRKLRRAGH